MITSEIEEILMEKLRVVEQISSPSHFEGLLYNLPEFQEINNDLPQKHFYLIRGNQVYGHISFELEEGVAHSHVRAPFGGFFVDQNMSREDLLFFIIEVERRLKTLDVSEIRIKQGPENLINDSLFSSLSLLGYELKDERIYQMIDLLHDSFNKGLHEMEKRKLKKANELDLVVEWASDAHFKKLFDFVVEQRNEKGFEFSMTWSLLKDFKKALPEHYFGIMIKHEGQIIAGALLVKENAESLYNFAPAHLVKYNRYSPMVYLTEVICNWAQSEGFRYLNLGTSYLGDVSNESLFSFKEKLGARPFHACTFQKVLNS